MHSCSIAESTTTKILFKLSASAMSATPYFLSSSKSNPRCKSQEHRKPSFRNRCFLMAKQQKTRFYILGRCISMLLCWHDHSISDWVLRQDLFPGFGWNLEDKSASQDSDAKKCWGIWERSRNSSTGDVFLVFSFWKTGLAVR